MVYNNIFLAVYICCNLSHLFSLNTIFVWPIVGTIRFWFLKVWVSLLHVLISKVSFTPNFDLVYIKCQHANWPVSVFRLNYAQLAFYETWDKTLEVLKCECVVFLCTIWDLPLLPVIHYVCYKQLQCSAEDWQRPYSAADADTACWDWHHHHKDTFSQFSGSRVIHHSSNGSD